MLCEVVKYTATNQAACKSTTESQPMIVESGPKVCDSREIDDSYPGTAVVHAQCHNGGVESAAGGSIPGGNVREDELRTTSSLPLEIQIDREFHGRMYLVNSLQRRLQSYDEVARANLLGLFIRKRLAIGETFERKDLCSVFSKELGGSFLCQRHYMAFNGIITNRMQTCACCKRKTAETEAKRIADPESLGAAEEIVLSETMSYLVRTVTPECEETVQKENEHDGTGNVMEMSDDEDQSSLTETREFTNFSTFGSDRASDIIRRGLNVCGKCYMQVRRKILQRFSYKPDGFPDAVMHSICVRYDSFLHGSEGNGKTVRLKTMYEEYKRLCEDAVKLRLTRKVTIHGVHSKPESYRTFCRVLNARDRLCIFSSFGSGEGHGSLAASLDTVKKLVSEGSIKGIDDPMSSPCVENIQRSLRSLCKRYKELKSDYMKGKFDILSEIRAVPVRLWTFKFASVESHRERLRRRVQLKDVDGDLSRLCLPSGNQCGISTNSLNSLGRASFRKVMRVLSQIQFECLTFDAENFGPLVWSFSAGVSARGGDALLKVANELGTTVHPNVMNRFQTSLFQEKVSTPPCDRIEKGSFCAFAHDNIDADIHKNTVADGERSKSFHGTISIAQQMNTLPPIKTGERYKPLGIEMAEASDMLTSSPLHVRSGQALLLGTIATFSDNLLSPFEDNATTLGHLMRLILKGHCNGVPANIEHLDFFELPSNSSSTTRKVLDRYLQVSLPRSGPDYPDYIFAVSDMPLFTRTWDSIYGNVPPGERNCELDSIVPVPGGMHFSVMALNDVVKRLCHHAFMNPLVSLSGLTEGAASRFLACKDPKTNIRVFGQIASACGRRIIDSLHESGDLSPDGMPSFVPNSKARPLNTVFEALKAHNRSPGDETGNASQHSSLHFSGEFPGEEISRIGFKVLEGIERKAARQSEKNFKHLAEDLFVNILLPCIMSHYLSRAGQIDIRNAMVEHLAPALFCTGKTNYYRVMLYYLRELCCAPTAVREALLSVDSCTTNLCGTNPFGNVEKDEALEKTGVASTKLHPSHKSAESLKKSFYTSGCLREAFENLRSSISTPRLDKKWKSSNHERKLSKGTFRMYQYLCGSDDRPTWLGPQHCAMPTVCNPNVAPVLSLTQTQQDRLLNLRELGIKSMNRAGIRFVPELRSRASEEEKALCNSVKTDKLEYFNELFKQRSAKEDQKRRVATAKGKKSKTITTLWRDRTLEIRQLVDCLSSVTSSEEEKRHARDRARLLDLHIDLVSIFPDAFLDAAGENPRLPHKARFWPKVQEILGREKGIFLHYGYPNIHTTRYNSTERRNLLYSLDLMNVIHTPVDFDQALTLQMHVQRCASSAISPIVKNNRRNLLRLDLHCDVPEWVVAQKKGTQAVRDNIRSGSDNTTARVDRIVNFDLTSKPHPKWKEALADRSFKRKLAVAVAAQATIEAAKLLVQTNCKAEIVISGIKLYVTNRAQRISDPHELNFGIVCDEEMLPHAVILHRDEEEASIPAQSVDASWVWAVRIVDGTYQVNQIRNSATIPTHVSISRQEQLDSRHGESETRMQFQMYSKPPMGHSMQGLVFLQDSTDSDNVCLALLSHITVDHEQGMTTFVKGHGKYYDIGSLRSLLSCSNLDAYAFVRLFCICGNDFNHACSVATMDHMIRCYIQWKSQIGDLSSPASVKTLFYFVFLRAGNGTLPPSLNAFPVMSPAWKQHARELIVCRKGAFTTSDVLPADEDLELVWRRAVHFNVDLYWGCSLQKGLINIPCDIDTGYNSDGLILLSSEDSVKRRRATFAQLNAKCNCGRRAASGSSVSCCQTGRCSCQRAKKKCDDKCGCPSTNCNNSWSTRFKQTEPLLGKGDQPGGSDVHESPNASQVVLRDEAANERVSIQKLIASSTDIEGMAMENITQNIYDSSSEEGTHSEGEKSEGEKADSDSSRTDLDDRNVVWNIGSDSEGSNASET